MSSLSNQKIISYTIRDDYFVKPFVSVYWMDNLIALGYSKHATVMALDQAMMNDDFILLLTGTMPVKIFLPENLRLFSHKLKRDYPHVQMHGVLNLYEYARSKQMVSQYDNLKRTLEIPEFSRDNRPLNIKVYLIRDLARDIYTIFDELNRLSDLNGRNERNERNERNKWNDQNERNKWNDQNEHEKIFPIVNSKETVVRHGAHNEPVLYDKRTECFLNILTQINLLLLTHGRSTITDIIAELEGRGLCSIPYNVDAMIQLMISESLLDVDRDGYLHL
jgi:hypothetical protein